MQPNPDTTTDTEVVVKDLSQKLRDDIHRACRHFVVMTDEVGANSAEIVSGMLSVLTATLFETMDKLQIPDNVYTEALELWRKHKADKLATDKTLN